MKKYFGFIYGRHLRENTSEGELETASQIHSRKMTQTTNAQGDFFPNSYVTTQNAALYRVAQIITTIIFHEPLKFLYRQTLLRNVGSCLYGQNKLL